jgi:hypothetical protein
VLHLLRRHLLPIRAHLESALLLTYSVPIPVLEPFLSPGLTLDTYANRGFLAIALLQARNLRPAWLPPACGIDICLSGYRIFTRYRMPSGRSLRGQTILRSDTDRLPMHWFGNLLTHYRFHRSNWLVQRTKQKCEMQVTTPDGRADLQIEADLSTEPAAPPPGSPFHDFREARKFSGPLPFTFDYERRTRSIIRVEGVRPGWTPRPVGVTVHRNTFLEQGAFRDAGAVLANAFFIEDVPYSWRSGVRERLP